MDKAFKEKIKQEKSQSKKRIKELKAQGKYEEIFFEFGKDAYVSYVPSKHRKQDLKRLKKEGRYEDIFNKHGESEYNKLLIKAMYDEIKEAKGTGVAAIWRTKEVIKQIAQSLGLYSVVLSLTISGSLAFVSESSAAENAEIYENEIQAYNEKINQYAEDINKYSFNDVQIFMKVMDDMWKNIKGYAPPEKDIHGYLELDLATEEGYGVCRNMANDIAKKLNEIDPKYNARVMSVKLGEDGYYEIADIERTVLQTNSTVADEERSETFPDEKNDIIVNLFGNHLVTFVDVPEDNLIIVLDPTNPGIGIYSNGKIIMLNSDKEDGLDFEAKEYGTAIFSRGGFDGIVAVASDYMRSFQKSKLSFEEIEAKYGINAQNEALEVVRNRVAINEAADEAAIKSEELKQKFDERYKVGPIEVNLQGKQSNSNNSRQQEQELK